jgi:hypothetical protein
MFLISIGMTYALKHFNGRPLPMIFTGLLSLNLILLLIYFDPNDF